jgi:hypothetical protein
MNPSSWSFSSTSLDGLAPVAAGLAHDAPHFAAGGQLQIADANSHHSCQFRHLDDLLWLYR